MNDREGNTTRHYKHVLVKDIPTYEAQGWRLVSNMVVLQLGGWHSVLMVKEGE